MWENMCLHHDSQLKIVTDLKSLDISQAPKETTKHHYDRTVQLEKVIQEWHLQFEKLVTQQTLTLIFSATFAKYCLLILNTCFVRQH